MPAQAEICTCCRLLYTDPAGPRPVLAESDVAQVFQWWGGVPRMVLEGLAKAMKRGLTVASLQRTLEELVQRVDLTLIRDSIGGIAIRQDTNQSLTHYLIGDDFAKAGVVFASSWIGDMVLRRLEAQNAASVRDWILSVAGNPAAASFAGHLFESFAHRALAAGGEFVARPLLPAGKKGLESKLVLPSMPRSDFKHISELQTLSAGRYAVPTVSNLAAGDSLALLPTGELLIFQCTVSKEHTLVGHGVEALVGKFPSATAVFVYFVVPETVFARWLDPQKYVTKSKGGELATLSPLLQGVKQHVLCLPLRSGI